MKRFAVFATMLTMLVTLIGVTDASDPPMKPRNAALLYWQAVALLPEWTDAEKSLLNKTSHDKFATIQLNDTTQQLVNRCGLALGMMRRGAQRTECDWGNLWQDGAETLLPQMGKARLLVRLAVLRARHHLQANSSLDRSSTEAKSNTDLEAMKDLVAAIQLARHTGSDNMVISQLVQNALERLVFDVISQNLIRLDVTAKRLLLDRLDQMPDPAGLNVAILREKDVLVNSLRRRFTGEQGEREYAKLLRMFDQSAKDQIQQQASDAVAVLELLDDMANRYDELAEIAKLPPNEIKPRWEALIERVKAENIIANLMLPSVYQARVSNAKAETRRAMLKAAVRKSLDQETEFQQIQDPFGEGAFGIRNLKTGFVLVSGLTIDGAQFEAEFR